MKLGLLVVLMLAGVVLQAEPAHAIPYFARQYDVSCNTCHVSPPKLNAFGEAFRQNGYKMPGLVARRRTIPVAIWASGRTDALPAGQDVNDRVRAYVNRVEAISGGSAGVPWLSYFVEWRPVSLETRRDGTLRDRSGRFEDIFLTASTDKLDVTVGQFRQIDQVDVSLRLGLSEPLALSASLPGTGEGTARQRSLRGFSPSGRSPSVRAAWTEEVLDGWRWTTSAALPLPGEFSIPLTRQARTEASNEFELAPKGVVVESFVHRGITSFGAHAFYDNADRYLANAVTAGNQGSLYWTGIAGAEKTGDVLRGRWSVEGEYIPSYFFGFGGRVEDRAGDGAAPAFLPYINAHFPGTRYTIRFTVEQRLQHGRNATLFELGTIF